MVLSTQVLVEFSAILLHKISPPANPIAVIAILHALEPIKIIPPNHAMIQRAIEAHVQYSVHFYDGLILAAAERGGCSKIWSEDFSAGQHYFGVVVENPFR